LGKKWTLFFSVLPDTLRPLDIGDYYRCIQFLLPFSAESLESFMQTESRISQDYTGIIENNPATLSALGDTI